MAESTNTLTLYSAVGILTDLLENTDEVSVCDNCGDALGETTWNICTGPAAHEGISGIPLHHNGHTACTKCAMDPLSYIADGGACRPCLTALGGRRSSVIKAGVALRPPVKNILANKMIGCYIAAKERVSEAHEAQDDERRKEGTTRRAIAVDDVRRRRAEEEEEAMRVRAEVEHLRAQTEEDSRAAQEKIEQNSRAAQEKIEQDSRDAQERIEEDRRAAQEKIEEDRRAAREHMRERIEEEHRAAQERMQEEAAAFAARLSGDTATADSSSSNKKVRKRQQQPQDVIDRRKDAMRAARDDKKRKLEQHDFLVAQKDTLNRQIITIQDVACRTLLECAETLFVPSQRHMANELVETMMNEMHDEMTKIEREGDEEDDVVEMIN